MPISLSTWTGPSGAGDTSPFRCPPGSCPSIGGMTVKAAGDDASATGGPATDAPTRQALVEATFRLIARTGDVEPSVRQILKEAGLSNQAFYRDFSTKDELMLAVLDVGRGRLSTYLRHRMAGSDSPRDQVAQWILGVVRQVQDPGSSHRTRPFLVNRGRLELRYPAELERTETVLIDLLAGAIARGAAAGTWCSPDPWEDARIIHDYTMASIRRSLVRQRRPTAASAAALVDFAFRALHPADGGAGATPSVVRGKDGAVSSGRRRAQGRT